MTVSSFLDSVILERDVVLQCFCNLRCCSQEFNQALSEKRAAVVADYLTHNGVTVNSSTGLGVAIGNSTNRLVTITLVK